MEASERKPAGEQLQEWCVSIAPRLTGHQDPSTYLPTALKHTRWGKGQRVNPNDLLKCENKRGQVTKRHTHNGGVGRRHKWMAEISLDLK